MTINNWLEVAFRTLPVWGCAVLVAANHSRVLRSTLWNRVGLGEDL